jgi:hypothetical protein
MSRIAVSRANPDKPEAPAKEPILGWRFRLVDVGIDRG